MNDLRDKLLAAVEASLAWMETIEEHAVKETIDKLLMQSVTYGHLTIPDKLAIKKSVLDHLFGYGILQPLIDDPSITEIMVNQFDEIFIEKEGNLIRTDVIFESEESLMTLIQEIVSSVNKSVNTSHPYVDVRLDSGERINILVPPIAINGAVMTIRKFQFNVFTLETLKAGGTMDDRVHDFLDKIIDERANLFICGGTSSGKTTFLNAMIQACLGQRIVIIEDSCELDYAAFENVINLEVKEQNNEYGGGVSASDLIRNALRMRPDRIVIGEVRGKEAFDLIQAMNTGHDGSMGTGHGNSPVDMLYRLETMIASHYDISEVSLKRMIVSAIDYMIFLKKTDGERRLFALYALTDLKEKEYVLEPIFTFDRQSKTWQSTSFS